MAPPTYAVQPLPPLSCLASEDSNKEQQLYDLRHEVIESQIKLESSARMIEEYKEQINALQRKIIQLEAEKNRNE